MGHNCQADLHKHEHQDHIIMQEISHHIPYAIFSIAVGMILLSFLDTFSLKGDLYSAKKVAHRLFHSFHFLHIIFAVTGSLVTFFRFSSHKMKGVIIALLSSVFFCTISDIFLPYICGFVLGMPMRLHLCFVSELSNVIPFLIIGCINGLIVSDHASDTLKLYSVGSHFSHILISSLASLFYLVSQGFHDWYPYMGILFLLQIVAVVVPCTLADVVVPLYFAKSRKKDEKYQAKECHKVL